MKTKEKIVNGLAKFLADQCVSQQGTTQEKVNLDGKKVQTDFYISLECCKNSRAGEPYPEWIPGWMQKYAAKAGMALEILGKESGWKNQPQKFLVRKRGLVAKISIFYFCGSFQVPWRISGVVQILHTTA